MRARAQIKSHPVHPFLVAFPIGLFITSFVFDVIGVLGGNSALWAAAWYCIIAGLCGGGLAAIPGAIDLFSVVPPNSSGRSRGYKHAVLNVVVIALFIAVAAHRAGPATAPDGLSLLLSAIGIVALAISGWLGGTLVYRNQIAVDHRYANAGKYREVELTRWDQPLCKADELAEGQLLLADITGTRVAVGRCSEGIVAFSDRCTHSGGPLSDGALIGCTVQCPWHGSQFNVHTGGVESGPAKDAIEIFDAEVRDGQIFVRPRRAQEKRAA
ncbi:MAG TPA: DUF2231 domain-containing protein [Terriglobales bacterium]|jgi:uncharacterized membrane protein/nitrite reductase/ring-hydroxylating ferredoxin subunit|nr:DUF2231 domain-containing protein [Terriglobales bacterium]